MMDEPGFGRERNWRRPERTAIALVCVAAVGLVLLHVAANVVGVRHSAADRPDVMRLLATGRAL